MLNSIIHNTRKEPVALTVEPGKIYFVQDIFKALGGFSVKMVNGDEAKQIIKKGTYLSLVKL